MPAQREQTAGKPAQQIAGSPYDQIHTSGSASYRLYCLVTFYTRARQPLLDEEVIPVFIHVLREICKQYEYQLIAHYLRPNQVNLLLSFKPLVALADLVNNIKRGTAHRLFEALPCIEQRVGKRNFWADGYYVETIGYRQVEGLVRRWHKQERRSKAILAAQAEAFDPLSIDGKALEHALAELLPTECTLIKLLHGLYGERVHTPEEVAEMLSLKIEEVRQIEKEVLCKLRELLTGVRIPLHKGGEIDE